MEAYRGSDSLAAPWSLTKLYTDAKKSYNSASPALSGQQAPEITSLNRKLRIQQDRLIAWGLGWTDDGSSCKDSKGSIDKSIERAGLTEVVSSVMENIKGILDEVESLRARTAPRPVVPVSAASVMYPPEKSLATGVWTPSDKAHYEDLVKDLTTAIDLLCDLSKHKRVSRPNTPANADKRSIGAPLEYSNITTDRSSNPYHGLPEFKSGPLIVPRIDRVALALPEECPPPYNAIGNIRPWRTIGHLRHHVTSMVPGAKQMRLEEVMIPIMIEDACFDNIYSTSDIPLPTSRLDQLYSFLKAQETSTLSSALPKLLGCFEYTQEPRFGLVYELPSPAHSTTYQSGNIQSNGPIVSLFQLLESASKLQPNTGGTASNMTPPLEERFRLALELVSSFAEMQRHSITHQGFSSSAVALFPRLTSDGGGAANKGIEYNIRRPIITSFDVFSEYNIDSPPEMLQENLYRHPDDPRMKGPSAAENFNANFDLYSLGLVLLEIGLWHPLSDIFKEKYSLKDFQTRIEKIWIRRLAGRCGTAYMRAVQDCISFGNESSCLPEALAQVYARIKTRLHRCCLIDDEEVDGFDSIVDGEVGKWSADDPTSPAVTRIDSISNLTRQGTTTSSFGTPRNETASPAKFYDTKIDPTRELYHEPASTIGYERAPPLDEKENVKRPRYRFPDRKLPAEILDIWNNVLEQRLQRIVSKTLQNTRESCEIFLCYTGEDEHSAKPTACVMCSSTKVVRAALRRFLRYDKDVFDIAVMKGKIVRSKAVRSSNVIRSAASSNASDCQAMNPFHHQRPLCGASIGAYRDSEHMPPVSFGGVVVVDGSAYGMSVHHLIEDPEEDELENELPLRAMAQPSRPVASLNFDDTSAGDEFHQSADLLEESDEEDASDLDSIFGSGAETQDFEELRSEYSFAAGDIDDEPENGDTEGIMVGDGDEIAITQPALNDVSDDFFPCEEDKDDDHLDSHSLGHIHASSGLRRHNVNGVEHEIDWALLKLNEDRMQSYNLVAGGRRYCRSDSTSSFRPKLLDPVCRRQFPPSEDLYPRHIARSEQLSGLNVHCFGRTSGLQQGRVSQTMRLVRFHGRRTFSRTWSVTGDFGVGGDSGAWVVDNDHGRVCGHVLAWSSALGTAYISPMDIIFEDIRRTLGASRVCLPGGEERTDGESLGHESDEEIIQGIDPGQNHHISMPNKLEARMQNLQIKDSTNSGDLKSPYLLAHHVMFTGNPGALEREWMKRRSMLGSDPGTTFA